MFRLDRASGALHALGVGGAAIPVVKRGQVLPPGCGAAGRAVATRAAFIARDYTAGAVQVPPLLSEAIAALPPITTLSVPLLVADEVIGALTVSRGTDAAYEDDEVRLAEALAAHAAPVLARAQQASDDARRQQGASELSRLAGSLTQSLSAEAVCDQLIQAVVSLARGVDAAVWDSHGRMASRGAPPAGLLREPTDPRLRRLVELVMATGAHLWTPDLTNDPRLAGTGPSSGDPIGEARAVLAVPVRTHELPLGALAVTRDTGRAFTEADTELVQALADQAALALANARAYHDLQASRLAVLRHEKLVAVGRLAAGLAHELRNPLQNAVAFIAELRERADAVTAGAWPADPDVPGFLRQAQAELRRAASIVDRLLDSVRERTPSLASLDLRQVVTDAVALATPAATRGGTRIRVAPADTSLPVQGDAVMLTQVVLNLLTNALDAIEGPGAVEIAMRREPAADGPGRVIVRIRDTGHGIAPEALPHVFDLFYTTKAVGKGVGLGLALCQAMVEQRRDHPHQSRSGSGRHRGRRAPGGPMSIEGRVPATGRPMRVLVVDDEAPFRRLMQTRLAAAGHRAEGAESGEEALACLAARAFDVVLLDLRLPGLGGLATLHRIREAGLPCEVVVLTGQPDYDDCVAAMKLGAFHYLRKPTEPALIEDTLRRAVEHVQLRQENVALRRMLRPDRATEFVGDSPAIHAVLDQVRRVAATDSRVTILGESGTGKGLVARMLQASPGLPEPDRAVCRRQSPSRVNSALLRRLEIRPVRPGRGRALGVCAPAGWRGGDLHARARRQ